MDTLSVILPVYNEKKIIEGVLKEWTALLTKKNLRYTFIICQDGSTDGTKELLSKIKKKNKIVLNQNKKRRGYGKAVIDGINAAKSKYILCIDSDGQCDPKDFIKFWKNKDTTDILIGWRKNRADETRRKIFSNSFKIMFFLLFPIKIHDPSAPFVLFRKKAILPYTKYLTYLQEGFWWGFIGACVKKGLTIKELTINHRKRISGQTQVYHINKIPSIALRNGIGLLKLRVS